MKTIPIESLRRHLGQMLRSEEPVLVTRYGRLVGVFSPVHDPKRLQLEAKDPAAAKPKKKRRGPDAQLPLLRGE